MTFDARRLRTGELIAGGGGILLLAALFLLPWFGVGGAGARTAGMVSSLDGWHSLTVVRWMLVIAIATSVALVFLTAARRSPAVPATLSMITCVLGGVSLLLLLYRLIDHPGVASPGAPVTAKPGLYVGLLAAALIAYGGYRSLRAESSPFGDPASIETVFPGRPRPDSEAPTDPDPAERTGRGSASRTESSPAGWTGRDAERA